MGLLPDRPGQIVVAPNWGKWFIAGRKHSTFEIWQVYDFERVHVSCLCSPALESSNMTISLKQHPLTHCHNFQAYERRALSFWAEVSAIREHIRWIWPVHIQNRLLEGTCVVWIGFGRHWSAIMYPTVKTEPLQIGNRKCIWSIKTVNARESNTVLDLIATKIQKDFRGKEILNGSLTWGTRSQVRILFRSDQSAPSAQ